MLKGFRGQLFDFADNDSPDNTGATHRYYADGLLLVEAGKVVAAGDYGALASQAADDEIMDYGGCLIMPGFVDAHVHSVQTKAIASYGKELLDWLESYVFPAETLFEQPEYARIHTRFFLEQLLKNGTTTAAVFSSVHAAAAEALFEEALKLNMCIIGGNTWMDRNAPEELCQSAESSYELSEQLIEKYHNYQRLHFAVTPRYAITSSPDSLQLAAQLFASRHDLYLQTHISENLKEIETVHHHYPNHHNYLDVYDNFGLLSSRTLLGHGIHLTEKELKRVADSKTKVVHCPSSNLFLGSGLLGFYRMQRHGIELAMGSDVGAGTSFSMLQTLQDAYKVSALKGEPLSAMDAFYAITLGGAKALQLDALIGNFDKGKEADFVVIDLSKDELIDYRTRDASLEELLFALMTLGDDRVIKATYLMGERWTNYD
ncbi:MAG: guanine deaminase [Bacteroidales bacterium]|nr:guanine deaminase [Bacteroidales bacterium]MDD4177158.1 guanine deaminase [Bacteroidales bacterium]